MHQYAMPPRWVAIAFRPIDWVLTHLAVAIVGAILMIFLLGVAVGVAVAASTTIPERAQRLCGHADCTQYVHAVKGGRRRLTLSVDDDGLTFGTLTTRFYSDAGEGHVCDNCSMPTEVQATDATFMLNALLWQTPAATWQGELRELCGLRVPVIYKVYPSSLLILDHSQSVGASLFQIDVRVGCL